MRFDFHDFIAFYPNPLDDLANPALKFVVAQRAFRDHLWNLTNKLP